MMSHMGFLNKTEDAVVTAEIANRVFFLNRAEVIVLYRLFKQEFCVDVRN